ncbi:MAG: AAA family ATPase, partial [Ilumatobacteraceae bacterium]
MADDTVARLRALEERLLDAKGQLATAKAQNEKLSYALREARDHVASLREEVEKLTQPPSAYGVILDTNEDGTVDVLTNARKMRVTVHPDIDVSLLERGSEVVLNESLNVVMARGAERTGEVVSLKEVLEDGVRAIVTGRGDDDRVCELADSLRGTHLRSGDLLRLEIRSGLLLERLAQPEVEHLLLEEVPDISYADIGGLDTQIEAIADAVELPFLHGDLFAEHQLPAPKGILLYGPPGCGKTLIAKAVANSLA